MMWNLFIQSITDWLRVVCTILAFLIPFLVYTFNKRLHEYWDPPWKVDEKKKN